MAPSVLHILPHRGGGAESYLDALEALPLAQTRVALSRSRSPLLAAASIAAGWPRVALAARRSDLLHAHGDVAAMLSLPLLRARPSVWTTHGLHLLRRSVGVPRAAARRGVRAAIAACAATICTSEAERDELAALVGPRLGARLKVVPNTAPAASHPPARPEARAALGVPGEERLVALFAGRLEERKDPLVAVDAAQAAAAAGASLVLLVAGDGPLAPAVAARAGPLVHVLGHRDDPETLFAAADVLVMPSWREGASIAVLEAMRAGIAVVVADSPGNRELVGDSGLIVAAGDTSALTDALTRLAGDRELRETLGAAGRARFQARHSPKAFLAATAAVYSEALGVALELS